MASVNPSFHFPHSEIQSQPCNSDTTAAQEDGETWPTSTSIILSTSPVGLDDLLSAATTTSCATALTTETVVVTISRNGKASGDGGGKSGDSFSGGSAQTSLLSPSSPTTTSVGLHGMTFDNMSTTSTPGKTASEQAITGISGYGGAFLAVVGSIGKRRLLDFVDGDGLTRRVLWQ
ncbi:hypothetical protein B0T17DRAFT_511170 [Bombardia bombarda]|uniref:Uncharacterized protein n=1 Tax=Bombardia bombarda TaxID=252184 RepID=A0AA39U7J8_9PEZI|nr:hypothetical protein B0T17DRAFT_511170 [Bombardia bombarda]